MKLNLMKELTRRVMHLTIIIVIVLFFSVKRLFGEQVALLTLVALFIIFLVVEYLRLELNIKFKIFQHFVRPKEEYRIFGVIFFLSSSIICLTVFDTPIALAALLMTIFGDVAAAIVGKNFGTTMLFRNKTAVGFGTGLATNLIIAVTVSLMFTINLYVPLVMAFVASIAELLVEELDDNLVVPIVTGFVGQILILSL